MPPKTDWQEYYRTTKDFPPSSLLVKALAYVKQKGKAIDIGGGALKDTRYLLSQGFDVTVIDKEESLAAMVREVDSAKLHHHVSTFADFDFPKNRFDLASAMYALPFNPPETFAAVFKDVKASLTEGGIFCGQCFGLNDAWSARPAMTFHTKAQVEELLGDMETLFLNEREWDGKKANGDLKHWNVISFIARKA